MSDLIHNSSESNRMMAHFRLLGANEAQITTLMLQIHVWKSNNGTEWTVGRLKDLKTWFIQHLAGNMGFKPPWFSSKSVNGSDIPKGPFGFLFENMSKITDKKIIKSLSMLMVYTAYKLDPEKASRKQILKTVGSIQSTPLSDKRVSELKLIGSSLKKSLSSEHVSYVKQYLAKRNRGFKFTPVSLNTGKPFTEGKEKYLTSFVQGLHIPILAGYFKTYFADFPKHVEFPISLEDFNNVNKRKLNMPLAGSIALLQEAGAKARVIANPNTAAQIALYPLHKLLDTVLKNTNTDCTHSQEDGALWAKSKLEAGQTVYSVDLSGATDNFPRSLQLSLLTSLGLKAEAELIESLAGGIWMLSNSLKTDIVNGGYQIATTYTKGQPQGLYSSFPLFALTHNLLVSRLCVKLGLDADDSFRVLGDDIVLTDSRLHDAYREFMLKSGVPISEDKSLSSDKLAEFAGFVITRRGIYKPAKVPRADANAIENNFYNYLKVVGENGIPYLPSKVRKVARRVAQLPEEFGGLGLNSQGLSLSDRMDSFIMNNAELEIPRYFSMQSNFLRYAAEKASANSVASTSERDCVNWLYDQYNLYEQHVNDVINENATLAGLVKQHITEPHALAYQFSLLGVPDTRVLAGNKHPDSSKDRPFITAFESWKNKWSDLGGVDYIEIGGARARIAWHTNKPLRVVK
jgi:hypothetical protein